MQNTKDTTLLAYTDGLFGYAMILTQNYTSAANLVQGTCLRALNAKERPRKPSEVKGWLFTILRNTWLNQLRRRRAAREIADLNIISEGNLEPAAGDSTDPDILYVRHSVTAQVREAINKLPTEFREIIFLREYEELSYEEISTILECPAGTVMSRLARARSRLRILLAPTQAEERRCATAGVFKG
jgi:RNA polymerase sigma-70 factor (ECF subfamily)